MAEAGCLRDGAFQNVEVSGVQTKGGNAVCNLVKSESTIAVAATAAGANETSITQPAGTILHDLIFTASSAITTAGAAGDDLDFQVGTASTGAQVVAATALLDDGGAAVTLAADAPVWVIRDSVGIGANAITLANGQGQAIATSEAVSVLVSLYSATERSLFVTFTPLANDLAATGNIKVTGVFRYL